MKSLPEAPALSAATNAAGMMLVPGWVSMRKVSHFPPANAISAPANPAPPFVTLAPSTMMVAPFVTPASSSVTSLTACWPSGVREPRRIDARPWSVRPLARSTTAGGRSSYRRPKTHCASCRLSDVIRVLPLSSGLHCAPRGGEYDGTGEGATGRHAPDDDPDPRVRSARHRAAEEGSDPWR